MTPSLEPAPLATFLATFLAIDPTLLNVALGTGLIGLVSGGLGCFAYLRRQSLVGDVVSHASLLGVVAAFCLSWWITGEGSKSLLVLVPGAVVSGVLSLLLARTITERSRVKEDASLGVILALFFGGGLFLLRWIQRGGSSVRGHAGLEDYVFGMAAAMTRSDLVMIASLGLFSAILVALSWKELQVYAFDPAFARSAGLNGGLIDTLLIVLLVLGIVIGIQAVGVVLMIALLVTPASAARQWTRGLLPMVALAAVFGAVAGVTGALVSASELRVPTGPVVVLAVTAIFVVSLLFAPERGVIARARKRRAGARALAGGGEPS